MAKHTQTIWKQIADELFECIWTFCEIGAQNMNVTTLADFNVGIDNSCMQVFWDTFNFESIIAVPTQKS